MDKKKRRSSMKRSSVAFKEDDTTANPAMRDTRRISFSGKKSVREFHMEEDTKMWKDSYEISDHIDGSLGTNGITMGTVLQMPPTNAIGLKHHIGIAPSEDKENIFYRPNMHPQSSSLTLSHLTNARSSGILSHTFESINHTHQDNTIRLDNSIEVSLLDSETVKKQSPQQRLSVDARFNVRPSFSFDENEGIKRSASAEHTIDFMGELHSNRHNHERNMQADATSKASMGDCLESKVAKVTGTTLYYEDMDVTLSNDLSTKTINLEEKIGTSDNTKRQSIYNTQAMDFSIFQSEDSEKERKNEIQNATVLFCNKINDMSLEAEGNDSANNSENEEKQKVDMEDSLQDKNRLKRTTIHCSEDIKTDAPAVGEQNHDQKRQTIKFSKNDINGKMDICTGAQTVLQPKPPEAINRRPASKVVLVRRICTPIANKFNIGKDGIAQHTRLHYKQKQLEEQCIKDTAISQNKENKKLHFPFTTSPSDLLSPSTSSPLFFPEGFAFNGSNKCNLRQLCEALDKGQKCIYPDISEKPASACITQKEVPSVFKSTKETNTSDNTTQLFDQDLEVTLGNGEKVEKGRTSGNKCESNWRYYEADEMLLDNTSFLTKAKLGDETASRNSSKCSMSHRRETTHYNSDIKYEAMEDVSMIVSEPEQKCNAAENSTKPAVSPKITLNQTVQSAEHMNITSEHLETTTKKDADASSPLKISSRRQTIHTSEDMEVDTNIGETSRKRLFKEDIEKPQLANALTSFVKPQLQNNRTTMIFTQNNDIEQIETLPSSGANVPPTSNLKSEKEFEDSLENKLNEMRFSLKMDRQNSKMYASPQPHTATETQERMRYFIEGTPHRSIIEFELLERQAVLEQKHFEEETAKKKRPLANTNSSRLCRQTNFEVNDIVLDVSGLKSLDADITDSCANMSPIVNALTNKRLTANLTPNFPFPKKRHTLIFQSCNLEESLENIADNFQKLCGFGKRQTMLMSENIIVDEDPVVCESDKLMSDNSPTAKQNGSVILETSLLPSPEVSNTSLKTDPGCNNKTQKVEIFEDTITPTRSFASRIPVTIGNSKKRIQPEPSKTLDETQLNNSLETIPIARRTTLCAKQRDSIFSLLPTDAKEQLMHQQQGKQQQQQIVISVSLCEENPITISDVSVYYQAQRQSVKGNSSTQPAAAAEKTLNTTETLRMLQTDVCTEEPELKWPIEEPQQQVFDLCEENTINHVALFKNCYINLTRNSGSLISELDAIEKTRLSLVETLLDDDEDENDNNNDNVVGDDEEVEADNNEEPVSFSIENAVCTALAETVEQPALHTSCIAEEPIILDGTQRMQISPHHSIYKNASLCRRCRNCREAVANGTFEVIEDSFKLPAVPPIPSINMERLRKLRQRPMLTDVYKYFERKSLENSFNAEELSDSEDENETTVKEDDIAVFLKNLDTKLEKCRQEWKKGGHRNAIKEPYTQRLKALLNKCERRSWIFNSQREYSQRLVFDHRQITTFSLWIRYKELDPLGQNIEVQCIQIKKSRVSQQKWKPVDFLMDFQLKLELPFNVQILCLNNTEQGVYEMLHKVDETCRQVHQMAFNLWKIVSSEQASLKRIDNRVFVCKFVRSIVTAEEAHPWVQTTEFRIQIMNMRTICCKDIVMPPLHKFGEDIQFLPVGLDFLQTFLRQPKKYLKDSK